MNIQIKDMSDDMLVLKKISFKRLKLEKDESYYNLLCEEIKNRNLDENEVLSSLFKEVK